MNKNNNSQRRTLGTSHVPGGFYRFRLFSFCAGESPRNGQDCSDFSDRQPSPLRFDPYRAMGLTLPLFLALNFDVGKLLPSPLVLIFVAFAGFCAAFLTLRCKQICAESESSAPNRTSLERAAMTSRLEEFVAEDLIQNNLESKAEALREQLEKVFNQDSLMASALEDLHEIKEKCYRRFRDKGSAEDQISELRELESLFAEFTKKYKSRAPKGFSQTMKSFCDTIKDICTVLAAADSLVKQINEEKVVFKKLAQDIGDIANYLDRYPSSSSSIESLLFLSTLALNIAESQGAKGVREQKYWREAKHAVAYISQKGEEAKLRDKQNVGKISLEEMDRIWEEGDNDEMYELSILVEQALQGDSYS